MLMSLYGIPRCAAHVLTSASKSLLKRTSVLSMVTGALFTVTPTHWVDRCEKQKRQKTLKKLFENKSQNGRIPEC